jgi:ferrochelatase
VQIRTLEGIFEGELLNSPSISFITQIQTISKKVNEGDLLISNNLDDIKIAIKNGAYAIVFDSSLIDISIDKEIAWIRVDDIFHATTKLTRFLLSAQELKSYYCDDILFELINVITTNKKNIKLLSGNIIEDFEIIKTITLDDIIIHTDKNYMTSLIPMTKAIDTKENFGIKNLTIHSLFKTSFSYNNYFFDNIRLPYLYINQFLSLIEFIKLNQKINTSIDINLLKNIKYLSPIFIDSYYKAVDFGKSNRFIICNSNNNLLDLEINFLKSQYEFAKIDIIKDYKNDEDLIKIIKKSIFNALYIVGKSRNDMEVILNNAQKEQPALFS